MQDPISSSFGLRINLPGGRLRHNLEWTAWKLWDLRNWEVPPLEPRDLVSSNVSLCFSWLAYQTAPMYMYFGFCSLLLLGEVW